MAVRAQHRRFETDCAGAVAPMSRHQGGGIEAQFGERDGACFELGEQTLFRLALGVSAVLDAEPGVVVAARCGRSTSTLGAGKVRSATAAGVRSVNSASSGALRRVATSR